MNLTQKQLLPHIVLLLCASHSYIYLTISNNKRMRIVSVFKVDIGQDWSWIVQQFDATKDLIAGDKCHSSKS